MAVDIAAFYNDYDRLRVFALGEWYMDITAPVPHLALPFSAQNAMAGQTWGVEIALDWRLTEWWYARTFYAYIDTDIEPDGGYSDGIVALGEVDPPHNQAYLRSAWILPHRMEFDAVMRYVDAIPSMAIDSYVTLDLRLGWDISKGLHCALTGHDLLESRRAEFLPDFVGTRFTEVERGFFGEISWAF